MNKVIITVGICASGKTTWAYQYIQDHPGTVLSCRDDIRAEFGWEGYGDRNVEKAINDVQYPRIKAALEEGHDVVVADTNVVDQFRDALVRYVRECGAEPEFKVFPITLKEALYRNANRRSPVSESTVRRYARMWEYMTPVYDGPAFTDEEFSYDDYLRNCGE